MKKRIRTTKMSSFETGVILAISIGLIWLSFVQGLSFATSTNGPALTGIVGGLIPTVTAILGTIGFCKIFR